MKSGRYTIASKSLILVKGSSSGKPPISLLPDFSSNLFGLLEALSNSTIPFLIRISMKLGVQNPNSSSKESLIREILENFRCRVENMDKTSKKAVSKPLDFTEVSPEKLSIEPFKADK